MICQKISLKVAAKMLGISPEELRYRMQLDRDKPRDKQTYPIGVCKPSKTGKSFRCEVYRPLLQSFLGMTDEQWEKGLDNEET